MKEAFIEQQQRFFSQEVLASMQYFSEGRQFTSKKEIHSIVNKIFQSSKQVCFSKGTIIYMEGDRSDFGYFLIQGSVLLLSMLSENQLAQRKLNSHKLCQLQKRNLLANQLQMKSDDIKFNPLQLFQGSLLNHRVFDKLYKKSSFGLTQLLKSGIRAFTTIATQNTKTIMIHKRQFEIICSNYQLKRQEVILTPMCKLFSKSRGKQFLFNISPSIVQMRSCFNQILYNQGDFPVAVYYIAEGQCQIYKKQEIKNDIDERDLKSNKNIKDHYIPVRKKSKGQFIGLQQVVLNVKKRQFSVRSIEQSIIYKFEAKKFKQLLGDYLDIRKMLEKFLKQAHQIIKKDSYRVEQNIKNGFKVQQQTHQQDQQKLGRTIHRQIYSGVINKQKNKSSQRFKGNSINILFNPEEPKLQQYSERNKRDYNQILKSKSNSFTPEKLMSKTMDIRKVIRPNLVDNNIKIDESAYKRVMIKMGTYNLESRKEIFKVGSQFKNNFQPIIDEIVRRHNTFLTKLDPRKRKEFVASKFKSIIQQDSKSKTMDKQSTMYKTWTVRSMKRSMKKYQDVIDITPSSSPKKSENHKQIMSRFQGLVFPSQAVGSRGSKRATETSQQLSSRKSTGNRMVLVNHMMKPMVYFHNN